MEVAQRIEPLQLMTRVQTEELLTQHEGNRGTSNAIHGYRAGLMAVPPHTTAVPLTVRITNDQGTNHQEFEKSVPSTSPLI
jgi:hypothetical protein